VEIVWLGHSCFRLRQDDVAIVTDPFPPSLGLSPGEVEASAVTVSNDHPNHCNVSAVGGNPRIFAGPGTYEREGVHVRGFLTPPRDADTDDLRNTAFIFNVGNLTLCHLGDVRAPLTPAMAADVNSLHILMVPVGGNCTLPVPQVLELIRALEPRVVIPMHYKIPGARVDIGTLEPFLKEMGLRDVEPQPRLSVTLSSLPQEMKVVVLTAQGQQS
jgi:L-ascorbate metabolism protein UlaG (beta-lactamase superfamily)